MSKKNKIIVISLIIIVITTIITIILTNNKEKIKYNVTFDTNGGSMVEAQLVNEGDMVKKPEDPTKKGYIFIEWNYQNKIFDFSSEVTKDLKLTAKWFEIKEENTFVIKFVPDGGTTIANQIINEGNKVIKPEDPTKDGYKFMGWYLKDEIYDFENSVTENIELKAKWEKIKETTSKPTTNKTNNKKNNSTESSNKNEELKLKTPTLSIGNGYKDDEMHLGFTIATEGYYTNEVALNEISGWELYEKAGDKYNLVGTNEKYSIDITIDEGQTKTYVARVYALNKDGQKIYSGYSNEYKVDNK